MGEVILHRLTGSKKALEACRLIERLYSSGKRVAVWMSDRGRAAVLDEYLWTFAQNSFVPHALWDGNGDADEPVAIVAGTLVNPNRAETLVVADRLGLPGLITHFTREVDQSILDGADLILMMEVGQLEAIASEFHTVFGRSMLLRP